MSPASRRSRSFDPARSAARRRPRATAVEWAGGAWTYGELDGAAAIVAAALREAGLGPGSAVACLLPHGPAAVAAAHGVPRSGAALAFADGRWTAPEATAFLEGLRPAALLLPDEEPGAAGGSTGPAGAPAAGAAVPDVPPRAIELPGGCRLTLRRTAWEGGRTELEGVHTVVWTSGTAGAPRGVRLPARAHRASARGAIRRLGLGPEDRWSATLDPAHIGGLALLLRAAAAGARVALPGGSDSRFHADAFLRAAAAGRVTHASLVPAMLHRCLEADAGPAPPGLRCVLVGGAATPPPLLDAALQRGWPIALTYGLSEAASQVATAAPERVRRKPGTVGSPLAGVLVRIAPDGELRVRGPTVMLGYLAPHGGPGEGASGDPGRSTGRRASPAPFDERGWLRTGDLGREDAEGDLWITGRAGLRLVSGGEVVDPEAVEAVLSAAPGVREVAVTGVADPVWGERVVGAVVPRGGAELDEAALDAFARGRLSGARRPRAWIVLDALPRGARDKVDREALRTVAERRLGAVRHPGGEEEGC